MSRFRLLLMALIGMCVSSVGAYLFARDMVMSSLSLWLGWTLLLGGAVILAWAVALYDEYHP